MVTYTIDIDTLGALFILKNNFCSCATLNLPLTQSPQFAVVGTSTATPVAACRIQGCCNSRQRNDLGRQGRHRVTPTRRRFGGQLDNDLATSARPKRSVAPSCSTTLKATRNIYYAPPPSQICAFAYLGPSPMSPISVREEPVSKRTGSSP